MLAADSRIATDVSDEDITKTSITGGNCSAAIRRDAIGRSSNPNRTSKPSLEMQEMPLDMWTSNYKIHPTFRCKYN